MLAAAAVAAHCHAVIDAVAPEVVAVKFQLACFERLGAPGWAALEQSVAHCRALGLLVIADAKRGDIDRSAAAYGQALLTGTSTPFGDVPGLGADAMTASPYMGRDALEPLVDAARAAAGALFVLVRTSNPGAADIEDLDAEGRPVWEHVAAIVDRLGADAVVGATRPEHIARMRELMPRAVFLMPGVGAQGGSVEDLGPAFAPGPQFGLVTASRSIVEADERPGLQAAGARAEAARLRELAWNSG